jgi:RNA polymerase sigma-70 factor, ECF subfamily
VVEEHEDHLHWLHQIAGGDQDALARMQQALYPRLWRFLWVQLDGNTSWIEEVLQDVFLAVWQSAHTFRGEARFVAAWIFRIAHHHAANARRAQFRRPEGHAALLLEEDVTTTFEDAVVQRVTLAEALRHLAPKHQEVLYLVFYQGFMLDEVAQILNIPSGTVKSRLSHARRALHAELASSSTEVPPHA